MRKLCLKMIFHKQELPEKGIEALLSLSKSECRALKELLESEEDLFNTQGPSTPMEPDLIDLQDLEALFEPDVHLKPDLSSLKKKPETFSQTNGNPNAGLFL